MSNLRLKKGPMTAAWKIDFEELEQKQEACAVAHMRREHDLDLAAAGGVVRTGWVQGMFWG